MRKGLLYLLLSTAMLFLAACPPIDGNGNGGTDPPPDYALEMRLFVQSVSAHAKSVNPDFLVVAQNAETLLTEDGSPNGFPSIAYLNAIDGQAREDVFFGYIQEDAATPTPNRDAMLAMLDWAEAQGIQVLVVDHCTSYSRVDTSLAWSAGRGYASTATCRALDRIPPYPYPGQPYRVNNDDITSLDAAQNMLYFLNPCQYGSCEAYLYALQMSNFDLLVVDACYAGQLLAPEQVEAMKTKYNGGRRLVLAYLEIGHAEDYRSYWQSDWRAGSPPWLEEPAPGRPGRHDVQYWSPQWQQIARDCLDQILNAGFDGVYLDGIETYTRFE